MSSLARAALAAAVALLVLFASNEGRAELSPSKLKYALLNASFESVVTGAEEDALFLESFELRGKPSCVLVRYSGELIGTDLDASGHVAASFEVYIGTVEVEPYPAVHEATTSILPQIVSFSAFACGVPAGETAVAVTLRATEGDFVSTVYRTLEIWTERPVAEAGIISLAARRKAPENLLKAKRALVVTSGDLPPIGEEPVTLLSENLVLKGKSSCLLVRYSGEMQGADVDENGHVVVRFELGIGGDAPTHPNLHDLTGSGQKQQVAFSAFRCGLPPGPYDVALRVSSEGSEDQVSSEVGVLEVFVAQLAPAPLAPVKLKRAFLASSTEEVVAGGAKDLFRESLDLKGRSGCLLVRFSGELLGTNKLPDLRVVASFDLAVDGEPFGGSFFHEAPTPTEFRLVSLAGHVCGLAPGTHELSVQARGENGDEVTVGARTLEVWTGKGRARPPLVSLGAED